MVLKDDALSSVVAAIGQGRVIFSNIRKSVIFMLCTNVSEVTAVAVSAVAQIPIPLLPLQILYLNVLTDVFPALALGVGPGDPHMMNRKPRPSEEPVLTRRHWMTIVSWAVGIAACVLGALAITKLVFDFDTARAVTASFLTLGFAKLWFVFNLRDKGSTLLENDIVRNRWMWLSLGFCAILLAAAVYVPGISGVLRTEHLGLSGWVSVLLLSLVPLFVGQAIRVVQNAKQAA
jgi:Ca2+-transporting ATPase